MQNVQVRVAMTI